MAKKKNNNNNNNNEGGQKNEEEKKNASGGGDGGKKKAEGNEPSTVILKTEIHCEGCANKLVKCARSFPGVDSVKTDMGSGKLTVVGLVDPALVREFLAQNTKKKVDLVSPQPKKDDKKQPDDSNPKDKKPESDSKKPKEAPVTTAVIKMALHCKGCIGRIQKIVLKTKGVHELSMDKQKETLTVKGTMDVKALTEVLKEKFKRNVEIVPPKKEKEEGEDGGSGGGNGGGKKKKKGSGGGDENRGGGDGGGAEGIVAGENRMDMMMHPGFGPGSGFVGQPVYGPGFVGQPAYGPGYVGQPVYAPGYVGQPVHGYWQDGGYGYGQPAPVPVPGFPAHMGFNDENPNACSVM